MKPAIQAAAAARNAHELPEVVLKSTKLGVCYECKSIFEYGDPESETQNLSPCPNCGDRSWEKWGYRLPDGTDIPEDDVDWPSEKTEPEGDDGGE